jgi:hypothetical protein
MTHTIIPTQTATLNINSEAIDLNGYLVRQGIAFTANTASFNQADATVKIQMSNDNTNWENVTDGSITIASGTATQSLTPIVYPAMRYYRIVYTKNTNSAGTIEVIISVI